MGAYFDHNSTSPMRAVALQAWMEAQERCWQNPSSLHPEGGRAAIRLQELSTELVDLLDGGEATRLVWTSGASEANNMLMAFLARTLPPAATVAISAIEHPCLQQAALRHLGAHRVHSIPVNAQGLVDVAGLEALLLQHQPALVSVMAASNESGLLQPWQELLACCQKHRVPFHSDAAQWLGKLPAEGLGQCDWLTGSAHKWGGPKSCGFLLMPEQACHSNAALIVGGPQQEGRRAGTLDVPAVSAALAALREAQQQCGSIQRTQAALRDAFETRLQQALPGLQVISAKAPRLWNTSLLIMPRHRNLKWLTRLGRLGFAVSTGSACSSGHDGASPLLQALDLPWEQCQRVLRLSGGWQQDEASWQALAAAIEQVAEQLDAQA